MKWRKADNPDVIDQRGGGGGGGGMGGLPIPGGAGKGAGGLGLVGIIVFILIQVLGGSGGGGFQIPSGFPSQVQAPGSGQGLPAGKDPQVELKDFSTAVFTDVQSTWKQVFEQEPRNRQHA